MKLFTLLSLIVFAMISCTESSSPKPTSNSLDGINDCEDEGDFSTNDSSDPFALDSVGNNPDPFSTSYDEGDKTSSSDCDDTFADNSSNGTTSGGSSGGTTGEEEDDEKDYTQYILEKRDISGWNFFTKQQFEIHEEKRANCGTKGYRVTKKLCLFEQEQSFNGSWCGSHNDTDDQLADRIGDTFSTHVQYADKAAFKAAALDILTQGYLRFSCSHIPGRSTISGKNHPVVTFVKEKFDSSTNKFGLEFRFLYVASDKNYVE